MYKHANKYLQLNKLVYPPIRAEALGRRLRLPLETAKTKLLQTMQERDQNKDSAQNSAGNRNSSNERFQSLRDSENRAGQLSKKIVNIIKENKIIQQNKHKKSIGSLLPENSYSFEAKQPPPERQRNLSNHC